MTTKKGAFESPNGDGGAVVAFKVDDFDSSVDQVKANGADFADKESEHPWGEIAPFKDPAGTICSCTRRPLTEARA